MTLSGSVCDGHWSVSVETHPTPGGFNCSIQLCHTTSAGVFTHEFRHDSIFPSEREAVLAGLREGMVWVQLKMSKTLSVEAPGDRPHSTQ